jgi:hypothetical protein
VRVADKSAGIRRSKAVSRNRVSEGNGVLVRTE